MVSNLSIFRLKFSFKKEDDKGGMKKQKMEIFAECIDYTDAEKTVEGIIEDQNLNRYELCEYEIVRTKFTAGAFIPNDTLGQDGKMLNMLVENYFSNDNDGFFVITVKFFAINEGDKDAKVTYIVPSDNINNAITFLKDHLVSRGSIASSFIITDSKMDNAESLYLTEDTQKQFSKEV